MRISHEAIHKDSYPLSLAATTIRRMDDGSDTGSTRDFAYFAFALLALIILRVTGLHP